MSRAKGQNRPIAPRGFVQTGYELRNLETGECCYIPLRYLKHARRAKALLQSAMLADTLEACSQAATKALRAASSEVDEKKRLAIIRALVNSPNALQDVARVLRGGV
jgi:hypothetical protein